MGQWEDLPWAEFERTSPEQLSAFNHHPELWRVPGSETFEQVRVRMLEAVREIIRENEGKTVAVASHGMAIRALVSAIKGISCTDMAAVPHCDNTAVTVLRAASPEEIRVEEMGDTSHLSDALSTFARQRWWRKDATTVEDSNLWFEPLDLEREGAFFSECRAEAWKHVHGSLKGYDEKGFLAEARTDCAQDSRAVYAVCSGNRRAGLLQLVPQPGVKNGRIPFFYLTPLFRRRGLGAQLLGQATSVYRELGVQNLLLHCASDNRAALHFYTRFGFERTGVVPGVRVPLLVLEKSIRVPSPQEECKT